MRSVGTIAVAGFAATVAAHGLVTSIQGANGVTMPGLSGKKGIHRCPAYMVDGD